MENYTQNGEFSVTENVDNLTSEINVVNNLSSNLESPENIISEVDSDDLMDSMLSDAEQINSELDLPTSEKYIGGDTDNISVIVDNSNNRITATIKQIKFKTASNFPPAGSSKLLYVAEDEKAIYYWDSELAIYVKASGGASEDSGYDDTEIRSKIKNLEDNKAEKTDLDNYYTKSQTYTKQEVDTAISNVEVDLSGYYTKTETDNVVTQTLNSAKGYTDTKVADLVNSAPETLDTLGEVAKALQDNETVVDALNSAIGNKVDKVEGKGLSTNDFTTEEKTKLAGIEEGANKTVVDDTFSLLSTNPLQNKVVTSKLAEKVNRSGNENIEGVKTFKTIPLLDISTSDNPSAKLPEWVDHKAIVNAEWVRDRLAGKQDTLIEGTNIRIDGNTISADLSGSAPITVLESPVYIWNLPAGVFKLPENCELYYNSSSSLPISYRNSGSAMLIVSTTEAPTNAYKDYKRFYLFAPEIGQAENFGSTFISGRANETQGYHETIGASVHTYGDEIISGIKTFQEAPKLSRTLATDLNDESMVNAQWVKAQGYLNESDLDDKGYIDYVKNQTSVALSKNNGTSPTAPPATDVLTERAIATGLPYFNGKHNYTDQTNYFVPTTSGTTGQILVANAEKTGVYGGTWADKQTGGEPTWKSPSELGLATTTDLANYFPLAGGTIGANGISWGTASLPEDTAPQYVCTIDAFALGGRQKWASIANLKTKLGVPTSTEILNMVYPVGSIYLTVATTTTGSASPASFLGGRWERLPAGYALWTASSGAGGTISAGLPNITGDIQKVSGNHFFLNAVTTEATASGAFNISSSMTTGYANSTGSKNMIRGLGFNANNGATTKGIYGNSTTVQPPAYKVYAWKRLPD